MQMTTEASRQDVLAAFRTAKAEAARLVGSTAIILQADCGMAVVVRGNQLALGGLPMALHFGSWDGAQKSAAAWNEQLTAQQVSARCTVVPVRLGRAAAAEVEKLTRYIDQATAAPVSAA